MRKRTTLLSLICGATLLTGLPQTATAAAPQRVLELVSPADKNGTNVQNLLRTSADGKSIAWSSLGAYADTPGADAESVYVARRVGDRWATHGIYPKYPGSPEVPMNVLTFVGGPQLPGDLSSLTFISQGSFVAGDKDQAPPLGFGTMDLYRVTESGELSWLSQGLGADGTDPIGVNAEALSEDGGSVFFRTAERLDPADTTAIGREQLYRSRNGVAVAVGKDELGHSLEGGTVLGAGTSDARGGSGEGGQLSDATAVSRDGSRFAYTGAPLVGVPAQVYVADDAGGVTQISRSQRTGSVGSPSPSGARYMAATDDLRIVFFNSVDQLTDNAPVGGGDYRFDTRTGTLTFNNPDISLQNTLVPDGLVRISEDGSRSYFMSYEVLAPGATQGVPNLYVRVIGEAPRLVAVLEESDKFAASPFRANSAPYPEYTSAVVNRDGSSLLFSSTADLTRVGATGRQIYEYEDAARTIRCVSCRRDGGATVGSATTGTPNEYRLPAMRVKSDDGRRIAFSTSASLVDRDTNGRNDVYEDVDGELRLITDGVSPYDSFTAGMSPDGADLFIVTRSALSIADVDGGNVDIYDARIGGTTATRNERPVCAGDACQGALPQPSPVPVIGSVTFTGGGNEAPGSGPAVGLIVKASAPKSIIGASGSVTVTVPGRGKITVAGSGLLSMSKLAVRAGKLNVIVRLTSKATRTLAKRKRYATTVRVRFTASDGRSASSSLKVTFKVKTTTKKGR